MSEQVKLKIVLDNILKNNLKISDEQKRAILDDVKNEVSTKDKPTTNTNIYINWMESAFEHWQREGPTKQTIIFYIDILTELSKNKTFFVQLHQDNIFKRITEYVDYTQDYDIIRMYIQLLDSFTHTEFGRNWIIGSLDCWKNVFNLIPSRKHTEELSVFFKDLFLNVVDSSELFSMDVTKLILEPLMPVSENGVVEEQLYYEIVPTINLLSSVIMCVSKSVTLDSKWWNHCHSLLNLFEPLMVLLEIVKGEEFTLELSKLLTALSFLELKKYSKEPHDFINLFTRNIMKILDVNTNCIFVNNITIISYQMQHFWFHIRRLMNVEQLNLPYDLSVGLCMYQIIAIFGICNKILGNKLMETFEADALRDDFATDFINKIERSMVVHLYKLRDKTSSLDGFIGEAHLSLNFLIKSLDLYNIDCQVAVFNVWLFIIGDIVGDIVDKGGLRSDYYDGRLVTDFINSFVVFADKCDITWKDVTIHMLVLDTATDLLQVEDLPVDVIVAALKMLDLAIDKHMAPNLILLVDSNSEVSIGPIGDLVLKNLNSEILEVRYAASKVLVTISESAKYKYPFFQKLFLELNVCQLLVKRIFSSEFVKIKANALKCLQHLVGIDVIWNVFGVIPEILVTLINSLKTETENLLRTEMVNLVTAIYEQDYFTEHQVKELYEIMARLGLHDFDVAVRINTLKFWDSVIKKLLIDEGMLDNKFPEFTFSKKSKKIVMLDEKEIQRRLRQVMSKLCEIDCLTVLSNCFTSSEKSEKQYVDEIVTNLLTILKHYGIDKNTIDLSTNKTSKKSILDDWDPKIETPLEFLEKISEYTPSNNNNNNEDDRKFKKILDQILRHC